MWRNIHWFQMVLRIKLDNQVDLTETVYIKLIQLQLCNNRNFDFNYLRFRAKREDEATGDRLIS